MAIGRMVHWIGVAFVSIAAILLLVTCVGAPTVHDIGLLKVFLKNASDIRESSVVYGPFGYCVLDVAPAQTDQDYCSHASIGYVPAQEMRLLDPATTWTTWKGHDLDRMTVSYVLFPIACFIAFCAAGFAFCGVIGSLIASVLCATAFVVTFPVMVVAFVSMGDLKSHVQAAGLKAHYGTGIWACLAAFILLFFAMLLLFFSCCSGLRGKHKDKKRYNEKHSKHREDSERSLNNTRSNEHHYGRDAALGGAGVGAYEAERHHHNRETNGHGHGLGHNDQTNGNHHYGRDAALGGAGVGAYEAERHHHNRETNGHGLGHNDQTDGNHHYGRDAALGGAGVGAYEAERHHHNNEHKGLSNTGSNDHHYGRDAAIGTAGVGVLAAERHHHNEENHNRDISGHGRRHAPANDAAARAAEGVTGLGGYNHNRDSTRGNNYDSVLANQDRQSLTPDNSTSPHHYGRDAALGGGAVGAGGLAAHEYERSRATPTGAGVAVPAPREHKLRETLRDSSHRGYEEPMGAGGNGRYSGQAGAPVHNSTTLGGNSTTHHHPTTTTSTSTYADERGVYNTGLETRTHDPNLNAGRGYTPGSAI